MAKQKLINEMVNSSRNANVMVGSPYVTIPFPLAPFTWKMMVIIITDISMKRENLKYQAAQYSQPFIPISFIDS